jgi:hypothetical protein
VRISEKENIKISRIVLKLKPFLKTKKQKKKLEIKEEAMYNVHRLDMERRKMEITYCMCLVKLVGWLVSSLVS